MPWGISRSDETHIEGERFRCATMISTTRGFTTNLEIQSTRRRWMSTVDPEQSQNYYQQPQQGYGQQPQQEEY